MTTWRCSSSVSVSGQARATDGDAVGDARQGRRRRTCRRGGDGRGRGRLRRGCEPGSPTRRATNRNQRRNEQPQEAGMNRPLAPVGGVGPRGSLHLSLEGSSNTAGPATGLLLRSGSGAVPPSRTGRIHTGFATTRRGLKLSGRSLARRSRAHVSAPRTSGTRACGRQNPGGHIQPPKKPTTPVAFKGPVRRPRASRASLRRPPPAPAGWAALSSGPAGRGATAEAGPSRVPAGGGTPPRGFGFAGRVPLTGGARAPAAAPDPRGANWGEESNGRPRQAGRWQVRRVDQAGMAEACSAKIATWASSGSITPRIFCRARRWTHEPQLSK